MKQIRKLLLIIAIFLPNTLKIFVYRQLGWNIGGNVKIGFSYIDCELVTISNNGKIGHFNIIRRLKYLEIGKDSYIRNFNQFFFSGEKSERPEWAATIVMKNNVHFMSHHFIDADGSVLIDDDVTIAGRDTHIWTHGFLPAKDGGLEYTRTKVSIGKKAYIGSRASILNNVPDRAIVGLGSIVNKSFTVEKDSRFLIAGNPAVIKKQYL